jgi:hypothetical protein
MEDRSFLSGAQGQLTVKEGATKTSLLPVSESEQQGKERPVDGRCTFLKQNRKERLLGESWVAPSIVEDGKEKGRSDRETHLPEPD